ncbi:MAG: hypothetical protein WBM84_09170 [Sedimenticolaceae bacterium]
MTVEQKDGKGRSASLADASAVSPTNTVFRQRQCLRLRRLIAGQAMQTVGYDDYPEQKQPEATGQLHQVCEHIPKDKTATVKKRDG